MNSLVVLVTMVGIVAAAPQVRFPATPYSGAAYPYVGPAPYTPYNPQYAKPIAILRQSQDGNNFDGTFAYDFEAENGISAQASGFLRNPGTEAESQIIQGQYSYTSPEGTPIVTQYVADETGFHPDGAHLPVPPADPYRIA